MTDTLDAYAERLSERVGDWERATLHRIGGRIKRLKGLSVADLGALDNIAVARRDFHAVMRGLSAACSVSTEELYSAYADALEGLHEGARAMYDFRGKQWQSVRDTPRFSALCRTFAANTGGTMANLTRSGAVGFTDRHGHFEGFEARYARVLDRATVALCSGATDVNTAVRDALNELGSSGLCVNYRGTTRRAASAVRANILWGARQAARGYADALGEELGCDGIEISAHAGCRPSHEFMQGRQYSLRGERVVNGITYPDAAPALSALEEYGCRHTKFPIILGVSAPSQSAKALSELNARRGTPLTVNGERRTVGEWETARDRLNSRIRARRDTLELLSSSGDAVGASGVRRKLNALYERRSMIDDALLTNRGNGGIIDIRLNSIADPLAEVLGSGEESHPHEIAAFREEIASLGVTLVEREQESLGYAPGLRPGEPGMIYVSKGASYGAWCHEMQHMRDDRDAGWEGMRAAFKSNESRYQREVRAYQIEIDQAEALGRPDIADRLRQNLEEERKVIFNEPIS